MSHSKTNKRTKQQQQKLTPFTTENGCVSLAAGLWVTQLGEGDLVPENALGWGLRRVRRSQAWLLGTGPWSLQLCGGSGWLRCSRRSLGDPVDSGPGGACPRGEAPRGGPRGLRLSAPVSTFSGCLRRGVMSGTLVLGELTWCLPCVGPITSYHARHR